MELNFTHTKVISGNITISGSKSESNRALLLRQFLPDLQIKNLSDSDDTNYLSKAFNHLTEDINIGHAGTAMRFLTAYYAIQEGKFTIITGSERMKERPILILVNALRQLGADVEYIENEGFPPLKIVGKRLKGNKVSMKANVSSQYISALLLIAPFLENGMELNLHGKITSLPYINMTLSLLSQIGVKFQFSDQTIKIEKLTKFSKAKIIIESDWSSASYYYSLIAISKVGSELNLSYFYKNSLQGDSILSEIFKYFGVETSFGTDFITLKKNIEPSDKEFFEWDFTNCPDIAQTVVVTCLGLGINARLSGLHTLKIKETDRLKALKNELEKLGANVVIDDESLQLISTKNIEKNCTINTYNDHRMAMAFAPLALIVPLNIENPEVVSKSYPNFWKDLDLLINN